MVKLEIEVDDGHLDLSMAELQEVPLKEIVTVKRKVKKLDLSNNQIMSLQPTFASQLTQLVELDLSKNQLTEVPDNFGLLVNLVHLDLYSNKIERLPLSFKDLTKLRWLDLKDNCLTPQLSKIAGPCVDQADCQKCARDVVLVMQEISRSIDQEKQRKQDERQQGAPKEKKKKRKSKSVAAATENSASNLNVEPKPSDVVTEKTAEKLGNTENDMAPLHCSPCVALPLRICKLLLRVVLWSILLSVVFIGTLYVANLPQSKPYIDKAVSHLATLRHSFIQLDVPSKMNASITWLQLTSSQAATKIQDFVVNQAPDYLHKLKMVALNCFEIVSSKISQLTNSKD